MVYGTVGVTEVLRLTCINYNVHCTIYTIHCTMYICAVECIQCSLYKAYITFHMNCVVNRIKENIYRITSHQPHHCRTGKGWKHISGSASDISVGGKQIWCVNSHNMIYMRTQKSGWKKVSGKLKQVTILINYRTNIFCKVKFFFY